MVESKKCISNIILALVLSAVMFPALTITGLAGIGQAAPGTWGGTGSMLTGRTEHTATLLPDGRVLVVGGHNNVGVFLNSAELYDPLTMTWSAAAPLLGAGRTDHTATLLPDGKVLVAGGYTSVIGVSADAEIYDPAPGTWSTAGSPDRYGHTATLLLSGKVLVVGGVGGGSYLADAMLYDPATGSWGATSPMSTTRNQHSATLLPNGKVLVAGGQHGESLSSAEIYDPATGTWSPTGSMSTVRVDHTANLLPNGKVLVEGGLQADQSGELYDPVTGTWSPIDSSSSRHYLHTATLLWTGKLLTAGGYYNDSLASCELYNPATNEWSFTGPLGDPRHYHTATRLASGQVLVAGGTNNNYTSPYLSSAELYDPEAVKVKLPSLLAFYPFDGNPQDASGNGLHGTLSGPPTLVAGYQGQAYSLNGAGDYITAPLDINPSQHPRLTMGAWVKAASAWPLQVILTHDNGNFDRNLGIDYRGASVGWSAFCGPSGQVLGGMPSFLGAWTFVAVKYDQAAQTVKLQVEDMVITKTGVTLGPGQNQLFIGASPLFMVFFAGVVDNVFVFGDVLSDEQIGYIRQGGAQAILSAKNQSMVPILDLLLD
ncbi:MAG: kelch repeat-containing protein [Syntrophobacteraceae bacterium]